ncbi:MAG: DUF502 domain-containing protein [Phycisphaerae bacterium]|jgi:uncharacterized membrane protein
MAIQKNTIWSIIRANVTTRLISGILLLMPFGITLLVMRWLFGWVAGLVRPIIIRLLNLLSQNPVINSLPDSLTTSFVIVFTIIVLLAIVYFIGEIGQRVLGKKTLEITEIVVQRIPLVRSIYSATKQVIQAISMPNKAALKSVVLVDFPRPGLKAVGFLTGHVQGPDGKKLCKIFIPTSPNPTTGFFEITTAEEITETTLTIEEAFKMIISGGIVSPNILNAASSSSPLKTL